MFCHFLRQGTLRCVITVRRRSAVMIYEIVLFFLFFFPQLIAGIFLRVATSHGGVPTRLAIRCGRSAVLNAGGNFLLGAPAGRAGAAAGRSGAARRGEERCGGAGPGPPASANRGRSAHSPPRSVRPMCRNSRGGGFRRERGERAAAEHPRAERRDRPVPSLPVPIHPVPTGPDGPAAAGPRGGGRAVIAAGEARMPPGGRGLRAAGGRGAGLGAPLRPPTAPSVGPDMGIGLREPLPRGLPVPVAESPFCL